MTDIFPKREYVKPTLPKGYGIKEGYVVADAPEPTSHLISDFRYTTFQEQPDLSFRQILYMIERDQSSQSAVRSVQSKVCSGELTINSEDEKAKNIIEQWNENTQFEQKLKDAVTTWLACGTTLIEKLDENSIKDVLEVDMRTIVGKKRNDTGTKTEYYIQEGLTPGAFNKLGADLDDANKRFIELSVKFHSRQEWGRSICYSNIAPRTAGKLILDSPIVTRWKVTDAMGKIFLNHASPDKFITYEGKSKEFIDQKALEYKRRKQGDAQIGDTKPEVTLIEPNPQGKYGEWLDFLDKDYKLGVGFPVDIKSGDFTSRASSQTTNEMSSEEIKSLQRYLTSVIKKELYFPILMNNGYKENEIKKLNLSITFEQESMVSLTVQDVLNMVTSKPPLMTVNEGREWLKTNGQDLFDDAQLNKMFQQMDKAQTDITNLKTDQYQIKSNLESITETVHRKLKSQQAKEEIITEINKINAKLEDSRMVESKKEKLLERRAEILEQIAKKLDD